MIAVVDYRAGNLTSVKKALDHLAVDAVVTREPGVVAKADKIILPGSATSRQLRFWNRLACAAQSCRAWKRERHFSASA